MKKLFSLLTLALLTMSVGAKTVTFVPGTVNGQYTAASQADEMVTGGVTISTTKGAFGRDDNYRFAKDSETTFTSTVGNITKVEITCTAAYDSQYGPYGFNGSDGYTCQSGSKVGIWQGDATSFTLTAANGQVRATEIVVTIAGGDDPGDTKVAAPTFDPAGGTFNIGTSVAVTVECATENASIMLYKVTEDPEWPEYLDYITPGASGYASKEFYVTEDGTYFAIAYKNGMDDSDTTFATYTFVKPTCAKPKFTPGNGETFTDELDVTISCTTEGATLTYTVNDDIFEGEAPVTVTLTETSTISVIASKEGYNDSEEATATYTKVETPTEGYIFTLVTDINDLAAGDKIIIANKKEDGAAVAMAGSRGNNFGGVNVVIADGKIQTNEANILTLEANEDFWNFKTAEDLYLYAPGGSNYLKTQATVDANANAAITIDADTTRIVFQGQGDRKHMRYNPNNGTPLFSCYAPTSNLGTVFIFKTTEEIIDVAAPVFDPANNTTFIGSQEVTITCETEGATIYYGFDGENYTEYAGPFTITEACTVYAYAKVGDAQSTVVQAKYYKANEVGTIAEALALEEGNTDFVFNGEAVVTYQNGTSTWIKDNSGYGLIFGTVPEMAPGTVIEDGWTAYTTIYYGVPEFASPKNVNPTEDVVTVEPEEKETVTNDDVNMYIIMKNQTLTGSNKSWTNADGLVFFKKFNNVEINVEDGKTYDIVGIVTIYNNAPEVYFISATEVAAQEWIPGDVNHDGFVDVSDVTATISVALGGEVDPFYMNEADLNHDDVIDVSDVTAVIAQALAQ